MKTTDWISVHIYYAGPLEEVLQRLINPFVNSFPRDFSFRFFFIRYYEDGAHIRFRIKVEAAMDEEKVKQNLFTMADDFFSSSSCYGKNEIHEIEYKPELSRYGGAKGIEVAEKLFHYSSEILLHIISEKDWNFKRAIGVSLQMHIIFLFHFFDHPEEVKKFLLFGHRSRTLSSREDLSDTAEQDVNSAIIEQEEAYGKQKIKINQVFDAFLEILKGKGSFENSYFDRWNEVVKETAADFKRHQRDIISNTDVLPNDSLLDADEIKKWIILESYMHMNNNRLGILLKNESYVLYILKELFTNAA